MQRTSRTPKLTAFLFVRRPAPAFEWIVLLLALLMALALVALGGQSSRTVTREQSSMLSVASPSESQMGAAEVTAPAADGASIAPALTPTIAPVDTPVPVAATPTPGTNPPTGWGWGLPDPGQWVQQALSAAFTAIGSGLLAALRNVLDWAMGLHTSSFNFISLTPPGGTYQSTSVVALWRWALGVMDAALAVIAMWGGYNALVRHQIGARYHSALEFLPRLALAALAANLSLLFAAFFIDLNNALCDGIGAVALPGYGQLGTLGQGMALLLLALIYGVVGLLLVLQMLLRLALLDLLIITGPLGLLCWALPQTQAWARLWTSTFVATTLVQFLQMATLKLGASLILELTPGRLDNAVLTLLVGIADLYLTFKIPGMLRSWALRSVGAASVGGLVSYGVGMARAAASVAAAAA
ncbi:MAG TPA: conjugal transfer protein TrbL family protein [Ktedonobacterales bacterium]|nr:conjugal transfer protein TrbL family protein [Ktedonobacterales bacterium]